MHLVSLTLKKGKENGRNLQGAEMGKVEKIASGFGKIKLSARDGIMAKRV